MPDLRLSYHQQYGYNTHEGEQDCIYPKGMHKIVFLEMDADSAFIRPMRPNPDILGVGWQN